jgi:hypothetical protein
MSACEIPTSPIFLGAEAKHVVYTELFGVADSSAAFGVGMTITIEQRDPESFFSKL